MAKSIQERVRAAQAAAAKARTAAEYKAGESARRSQGAKVAAEVRRETRLGDLLSGRAEPRTLKEYFAVEGFESEFNQEDM